MTETAQVFHWSDDLGDPLHPGPLKVRSVGTVFLSADDVNIAAVFKGDLGVVFTPAPGRPDVYVIGSYVIPNDRLHRPAGGHGDAPGEGDGPHGDE